ncbi:MAG: DEAD/DEAH box helicase [Actinobacteria bacterium]|nr:DEAD/DEAH box helicase [Actinomycetota bacterium]
MTLTDRLEPVVPARVRERGQALYRRSAVHVFNADDEQVRARVQGTDVYPVSLTLDGSTLRVLCECPYFSANLGVCKHIWATVLVSDAAGYLAAYDHIDSSDDSDDPRTEELSFTDADLAAAIDNFNRHPHALGSNDRPRAQPQSVEAAEQRSRERPRAGEREILYVLKAKESVAAAKLILDVVRREPRYDGGWKKPQPLTLSTASIERVDHAEDRQILSMLLATADPWMGGYPNRGYGREHTIPGLGVVVARSVTNQVIPLVCRTGRGMLQLAGAEELVPLTLDPGPPWELWLEVDKADKKGRYTVHGILRRPGEQMAIQDPTILLAGGFLVAQSGSVGRLKDFSAFAGIATLRQQGSMAVPADQIDDFLHGLVRLSSLPRLELPPELKYTEEPGRPVPRLQIQPARTHLGRRSTRLDAHLSFDYEGDIVAPDDKARGFLQPDSRRVVLRDTDAEKVFEKQLDELGLRRTADGDFQLTPRSFAKTVRDLIKDRWIVEAEGSLYRSAGRSHMNLVSGTDWFDLEGNVDFGDQSASLPELLTAVRKGESFVKLGDGSVGLVPEEWLRQYSLVASLGKVEGEALRFQRNQVGVLDALLAAQPQVNLDEVFVRARNRLGSFSGIEPINAPNGFEGRLRSYQRDGLGWLDFLREFGFGGCLADDMGLGKTVQVLALLEARREEGIHPPSLVVVPKSLVFNWIAEARRFTPQLKILDHTGGRRTPGAHFEKYDLVLTTYGTLRQDAVEFKDTVFDYCILDEAQAIKNPATASAKAARLIRAEHRLTLSGTPIENHLGELWSLFEFLNPGMLGSMNAFQAATTGRNADPAAQQALSTALRPFILRRTKEQVARDLPPKTEQTQFCDLSGSQRREYEQLRRHYRRDLLQRIDTDGIAKSKIYVLEALLRLRQAACHPGLIDPERSAESSAKLELLLPQLAEVVDEGHKAIVFSQFTTMLGILQTKLNELDLSYEYLDGKTTNRRERVERFQNDPDCRLFLISLKAGGLGLNLTAAEYVFLLDPWWNPAVEAQAIDRAHRIGQTMPVFAYRIIARGTVEEKVLQLQESKRQLADAIIGADNDLIRQIKREDLELLLS